MVWYDLIGYDMIWCHINWYDKIDLCNGMVGYDWTWFDMIWYDMMWYDMIWYDMIWYDMIEYDVI